jgi:membrane fusion protein (multidrug efflux system)
MLESGEDLARHNDGQAPGHGVGADVTGDPMSHDRLGPDEKHGSSRALPPSEAEKSPPRRKPFYKRPLVMAVLAMLLLGGAIAGLRYWQYARQHESTDDAFIQGHIIQISPKVSAQVMRVLIDDNMEVKQGDLLIELDPGDFEVALKQAQTNEAAARGRLQQAQAQLAVAQANVAQAQAQVVVAQANAVNAQADLPRYQSVTSNAVSRQQVDSAIAAARTAKAKVDAARQQVSANQAQVAVDQSQITTNEAEVQQAQAQVQQAQLNLSYTKLYAPANGRITQKNVEPGDYVQTGQALFALVQHDVWVVANFKETQLTYMRSGQPAEIEVDTYPNHPFQGHVDSLQMGTGTAFSLLPPENATGNYVKVVQRVPVKIVFDEPPESVHLLAPGMSVVPEVKVR